MNMVGLARLLLVGLLASGTFSPAASSGPVPDVALLIYEDNFEGDQLGEEWDVWIGDEADVAVSDGRLALRPLDGRPFPFVVSAGGEETEGIVSSPLNREPSADVAYRIEFLFEVRDPGTLDVLIGVGWLCQVHVNQARASVHLYWSTGSHREAEFPPSAGLHELACVYDGTRDYVELDGRVLLSDLADENPCTPVGLGPGPHCGHSPQGLSLFFASHDHEAVHGPGTSFGELSIERVRIMLGPPRP